MSINGVSQNLYTPQALNDKKTGRANEEPKKDADKIEKKGQASQAIEMNKLIIEMSFSIKISTKGQIGSQAGAKKMGEATGEGLKSFDLSQLSYNGKPITSLSKDEANALVSEDGDLGVNKTAQRIFDFTSAGAGDNIDKLQLARDAINKGFKEAEAMFGGKLPDISYETIKKVFKLMDEKIRGLGGSVIDVKA